MSLKNECIPVCLFNSHQNQMTCMTVLPTRSPASQALWETMLTSKHKEGVMEVRRQLVETASKEKLPIKMSMGKKRFSGVELMIRVFF